MEDNKPQIQSNPPLDLKNPIFKPRPGWGGKFNIWIKRNFQSRVLPTFAVLVFVIGVYSYFINRQTAQAPVVEEQRTEITENIQKVVGPGQSITHVVRSIIAEYLMENSINISNEQKIFMETYIVNQLANKHPRTGEALLIKPLTIEDAVDKAKSLNEYQLKAWSRYVK